MDLPLSLWARAIGTRGGFDPHAHLEQELGRTIDRDSFDARRRALYEERMQGRAARPGVSAYLETARTLGLRVGLASSSGRSWVEGYLRRLGLFGFFSCIRTADDVSVVKPDPELYLSALCALEAPPAQAVAFEDSPNGALAAVRAGMVCVTVPNSITATLSFPDGIARRLSSMEDVPLSELLAGL